MVLAGVVALVTALYLIGDKRNMFGDTFIVKTRFRNVNGLGEGNNVRFSGIDVGTVRSIEIVSDTSVIVTMVLEEDVRKFIRQDAQASISTDGMMGNKLVNIESRGSSAPLVTDGFLLPSIDPLNMDETTRTLSETNKNVQEITANLKHMTYKLDSSAFWQVLSDTTISKDLKGGVHSFSQTMEAVRNSFLVNGYFKKKEKEREKEKEKKQKDK